MYAGVSTITVDRLTQPALNLQVSSTQYFLGQVCILTRSVHEIERNGGRKVPKLSPRETPSRDPLRDIWRMKPFVVCLLFQPFPGVKTDSPVPTILRNIDEHHSKTKCFPSCKRLSYAFSWRYALNVELESFLRAKYVRVFIALKSFFRRRLCIKLARLHSLKQPFWTFLWLSIVSNVLLCYSVITKTASCSLRSRATQRE